MWLYRFANPETRGQIPTLGNFLKWNHDVTMVYYEQTYLPYEERLSLLKRVLKFVLYLGLLMIFVYVFSDVHDGYYSSMCDRREKCLRNCASDYYPRVLCGTETGLTLSYGRNTYSHLYYYPMPSTTAILSEGRFYECANYARENAEVDKVPRSGRQARVHTCFGYCNSTGVVSEECISEGIACVVSSDACEFSVQLDEYVLSSDDPEKKESAAFSPLVGLIALAITMPLQLVFELYCIYISKLKTTDKDDGWVTLKNTVLQFVLAAIVVVVLCYDVYFLIDVHTVRLRASK